MWYLPGRHHERLEHVQLWDKSEKKGFYYAVRELDETGAAPAEVRKGGFAVHHCRDAASLAQEPHRRAAASPRGCTSWTLKMPDPDMLKILPEGATPLLRGRAMSLESS